jgi:biopolymer transport protein ExbB
MGGLQSYYASGGLTMHAITVCAVLGLAAIATKLVALQRARTDSASLLREVRILLLQGNVRGALAAAGSHRGPVAAVVTTGLLQHGAPRERIERAMETTALAELSRLERTLALLSTVATVAPLLGFFGTVLGMLAALDAVSSQGFAGSGAVAGGIRKALVTTAYGLAVAFVVQPFHAYFTTRINAYGREMETAGNILLDTFDEIERLGARG